MKIRNNSAEEEKSKGSQILIQKYWTEVRSINYKTIEEYAQSIDIILKGNKKSIRIINIYMVGNNKDKKKEIISTVDKWIENGKNENLDIIVMGDFNERRQNIGKKDKNNFLELIDSHNMVDIHTYFNNNDLIDTWTNGTISTRIDYIFVNSEMLQRIDEHEVLNVENKLSTDHKALTITIKIENETTNYNNNKGKDTGYFRHKFSGKEWEEIAERVEKSIIERQTNMDESEGDKDGITTEIDKKWNTLKYKEYNTSVKDMSDCDKVKTKLKIINEIEKLWKKWDRLVMERNKFNEETRRNLDVMENFGAKERNVITNYKILVHRFNDICNSMMTTETENQFKNLHDNLEDSISINRTKDKIEIEKNRLLCDMENVQQYEYSLEIEKNIEKREQLMTTDLKEMIIRIMDKRRGQIRIDSCQKISENRVRMITNHEEIKDEVVEHYKNWTCARNFDEEEFDRNWSQYYNKFDTIDEHIYDHLCDEVTMTECNLTLNNLKYDKAAGVSGIPYDFWKKSGDNTKEALIEIINLVIKEGTWPKEWKDGIIYPIKKTMEWNRDLKLTRPITLIETARKITIKILTNRLNDILTKYTVLKGKNFAALKYESTFEPIKILQAIIEDANINKKEAWIVLMDISKAYDSVSSRSLRKGMERIKLPEQWINLVLDISYNRFNRVIVNNDLTEKYKVEDGIDQGEVWSPILWRIFYDPLLCKLDDMREQAGYEIKSEFKENITKDKVTIHSMIINAIAFMDDMTLISRSHDQIMDMLEICHSFYRLNDIKANPKKYEIIRINNVEKRDMIIEGQKIEKINSKNGNRFLGIFFTYNNNRAVHIKKMKDMIEGFVKIMNRKIITDKQVCKLWNTNMIPALEYQLQGVVITENEAKQLMAPINTLIKHKCKMPSSLPNCVLYDKDIYGVKDIYSLQFESLSKNIMYMANGNEIVRSIFKIQMEQLQQEAWTPLCFAEKVSQVKFSTKRFVRDALIVLDSKKFHLCDHENYNDLFRNHRIRGGYILIEEVLEEEF
ncbi:Down syndrome cell adhesion molecule-like protein Dscam2 [Rhizophagus irregularis DAOM 181602=DAOM 197198]|nr:Down syndrome cell adhesion molecule-like protein Dscam2 [Rhizophagus irregularis DAOM 181602=DAOM 197198]